VPERRTSWAVARRFADSARRASFARSDILVKVVLVVACDCGDNDEDRVGDMEW
jgi:hypothetical protein